MKPVKVSRSVRVIVTVEERERERERDRDDIGNVAGLVVVTRVMVELSRADK